MVKWFHSGIRFTAATTAPSVNGHLLVRYIISSGPLLSCPYVKLFDNP